MTDAFIFDAVRTPRGRKLTPQAYVHLGKEPPEEPELPLFR